MERLAEEHAVETVNTGPVIPYLERNTAGAGMLLIARAMVGGETRKCGSLSP